MTLSSRLDRLEAALGGDEEPGLLFIVVADDGIPRTDAGEQVDLDAVDPRTQQVILYRQVPAGARPAAAGPHPER